MAVPSSVRTLRDIAANISALAEEISDHLEAAHRPPLSFSPDGDQELPTSLAQPRASLLSLGSELLDLVTGPEEMIVMGIGYPIFDLSAIITILHCKMYNHVPLDGSATYAALAHAAGLSEIKTRSILRHAMTKRIFAERDGCVVHTAVSAMFVRNPYLADWIGHMCDDALPAVTAVPKMIDLYGTSAAPNHSAINVAFDTSLNGNVFIATHPVRGPRFFRGLRCLTATGMFRNSFLVDGYPWHEFKTVVDVGGGNGDFCAALAQKCPGSTFIVQDQAEVQTTFEPPPEVASHLSFQIHDFFSPQTLKADAYVLKLVCHDWPDNRAAEIIRNLVPAMHPSTKIIIIDTVVPEPGEVPFHLERIKTTTNLNVVITLNAHERSIKDWTNVVALASDRLRISRIVNPPGSYFSEIEVVLNP